MAATTITLDISIKDTEVFRKALNLLVRASEKLGEIGVQMAKVAIDHIEIRWRPADSAGAWKTASMKPGSGSFTITGISRGVTYQVEARNVGTNGAASPWTQQTHEVDPANVVPLAPVNLASTVVLAGILLSWTAPQNQTSDAQYDVERCGDNAGEPDGNWTNVATVVGCQYTDLVTETSAYWYRVRAVNFQGLYSSYAGPAFGTPPAAPKVGEHIWVPYANYLTMTLDQENVQK